MQDNNFPIFFYRPSPLNLSFHFQSNKKISMRKFSLMAFLIATSIFGTAQIKRIPTDNKANSDSSKHAFSTDSSILNRNVFLKELKLTREQQLKLKEIKNATSDSIDRINNDPGINEKDKKLSFRKIRMQELQTIKTLLSPEQFEKFKARLGDKRKMTIKGKQTE